MAKRKTELVASDDGHGKLAAIMPTEARLALPEVVNVFINKYETKLRTQKASLTEESKRLQNALQEAHEAAEKSGNFSKWENIKEAKLGIISYLIGSPEVDWEDHKIYQKVGLAELKDGKLNLYRKFEFKKRVSVKLGAAYIKTVTSLESELDITTGKLHTVVSSLGDMSRKERQVKARISEMRLEEQGLSAFLEDGAMQALLEIDQ